MVAGTTETPVRSTLTRGEPTGVGAEETRGSRNSAGRATCQGGRVWGSIDEREEARAIRRPRYMLSAARDRGLSSPSYVVEGQCYGARLSLSLALSHSLQR